MAKVSMVRIRAFVSGVVALLLVIILAALGTAVLGFDVPGLRNIAGFFGVEVAEE